MRYGEKKIPNKTVNQKFKQLNSEFERKKKSLMKESANGAKIEVVEKWKNIIQEELAKPDSISIPKYRTKMFWDGFLTLGAQTFTGKLSKAFSPGFLFSLGSRAYFNYGGIMGFQFDFATTKLKNYMVDNIRVFDRNVLEYSDKGRILGIGFNYGHSLTNGRKNFIPNIFGAARTIGNKEDVGVSYFNLGLGLDFNLLGNNNYFSLKYPKKSTIGLGFHRGGIRVSKALGGDFEGIKNSTQIEFYIGGGVKTAHITTRAKKK